MAALSDTVTSGAMTQVACIYTGDWTSYKQPPPIYTLDTSKTSLFTVGVSKTVQVSYYLVARLPVASWG